MNASVQTVLQKAGPIFGSVPAFDDRYVCDACLGPKAPGYSRCFGCKRLFAYGQAPPKLAHQIVPITTALKQSLWYSYLFTYKGGILDRGTTLAAVLLSFVRANRPNLAAMLDGEPTMYTIVPSKKRDYDEQPLRKVMSSIVDLVPLFGQALAHVPGSALGRNSYDPTVFVPGPNSPRNQRVVLVEDSWASGATSVSAAGALLNAGAASVAIVPIARIIDPNFWTEDHPYLQKMSEEWAPDQFRRPL